MRYMITDGDRFIGRLTFHSPFTLNPKDFGYVFDNDTSPIGSTIQIAAADVGLTNDDLFAVHYATWGRILLCPTCRRPRPVSNFPECKELRECLDGSMQPPGRNRLMPHVACNDCQEAKKNPTSKEHRELVHAAWQRGEFID